MELKTAYQEQLAHHWHEAVECIVRMDEGGRRIRDWSYRPPASDDWQDWRGVTRWCAYEAIYKWHMNRLDQISFSGKPGFCWECYHEAGKKRPKGWAATKCLAHAWADYVMDEALAAARRLGAPVTCPVCGITGKPGDQAAAHYAACRAGVEAAA